MNDLQIIDWDLLRLQFEVLHESPVNLAEANNVSVEAIEYAIEEKGWKQKPYSDVIGSWKDLQTLEDKTDGIIDALKKRNRIIQLLKINDFNGRYTQLEATAISKIQNIIANIDSDLPTAAGQIKEAVLAIAALKELSEKTDAGDASGEEEQVGVHVTINNQVPEKETVVDGDSVTL